MKYQKFEELEVWQKARELVNEIYSAAEKEKFSKDFSLKNQIIRAGISVSQILQKDLIEELIKNSSNFCILQKVHPERQDRNCI